MRKLFKGGNYSRAETICGNTVSASAIFLEKWFQIKRLPAGLILDRDSSRDGWIKKH